MARVVTMDSIPESNSLAQIAVQDDITETDAEVIERLRKRFAMLEDMARAVKKGDVRALIVSGAPGVGKSYGVETVLARHDVFANVAQDGKLKKYEVIKGAITALGLYSKLYEYKDSKNILVFDDCDSILLEDLSLNILKAALDSSKKRVICWNSNSHKLRDEGTPNSFEYKGGCIFITNIKFDHVRSKKLKDHLAALESRCHYLDLTIATEREKMLRIKQIVGDGMLDDYDFTEEEKQEIVDFVDVNKKKLREVSLRTVLKAADLKKSFGNAWQDYAGLTLIK